MLGLKRENVVVRCLDDVVLEIVPGQYLTVKELDVGAPGRLITLTSKEVRACFEGRPLEKARAVANLSRGQFNALIGADSDATTRRGRTQRYDGTHYKTFDRLRYIGERITVVAGESLANETLEILHYAARFDGAGQQIAAAYGMKMNRALQPRKARQPSAAKTTPAPAPQRRKKRIAA